MAENADGGASSVALGAVSATDPENSTITYSIEAGDSGGLFAIDSGTGALSYQGAGEDYESGTTSYELTVRASDGGLHSDVTVTVNVTDVAEAPAFAETSYAFDLAENADGGAASVALGADRRRIRKTRRLPTASRRATPVACSRSTRRAARCSTSGDGRGLRIRNDEQSVYDDLTETQQSVSEPDGEDLTAAGEYLTTTTVRPAQRRDP